jgi:pterin-4a-carbinolamine dehydratase
MKQLQALHEEFIEKARRPMSFGRLPIRAKNVELPVVPMNRWERMGETKALVKKFQFRRPGDRNNFIRELLEYEEKTEHHADMQISEDFVNVRVYTKSIEKVTELDKEYADFADKAYKDIVMRPDKVSEI